MSSLRTIACLAATLLLGAELAAQEPRRYRGGLPIPGAGSSAYGIVVRDFDGDGRDDVATAEGSGGASILTSIAGTPGPVTTRLEGGAQTIAAGDLDVDGDHDLLTANVGDVTLWRRGTDGAWSGITSTIGTPFPFAAKSAVLADLDRDGDLDVLVTTGSSDMIPLRQAADGHFAPGEVISSRGTSNIPPACADLDGDGAADILDVAQLGLELRRGRGDGTFAAPEPIPVPFPGVLLAAADFRADGKADAVVVLEDGAVLLVEAMGTPSAEPVFDLPDLTVSIFQMAALHVTDFDGSGTDDLAIIDPESVASGFRVLLGTGDGSFSAELEVHLGFKVRTLASGDLDGDGLGDLIFPRPDASGLVAVFGEAPAAHAIAGVLPLPLRGRSLGVVDVQPDGVPDLLITSLSGGQLLLGDGAGGFQPTRALELPDALLAHGVEGDFDGDGRLELAAADQDGGRLLILRIDRAGEMVIAAAIGLDCLPSRLAAADLDGDGRLDVAATCRGREEMVVVLRPTDAQPVLQPLRAGPTPTALVARDMDGDARGDLAVATAESTAVLLSEGAGSFRRALEVPELALARSLHVADADASGDLDLIGLRRDGLTAAPAFLAGGAPIERLESAASLWALELADIAGDGRLERVLLTDGALHWVAAGAASLEPRESYAAGLGASELRLVDLDQDGRRDIAVLEADGRDLRVLRASRHNTDAAFRRGDVDASNKVDITDAVAVLESLFRGAGPLRCPDAADADDDGNLVLTDVIHLLLYQFQGGGAPPAPGPDDCGIDPTPDLLEACASGCGGAR